MHSADAREAPARNDTQTRTSRHTGRWRRAWQRHFAGLTWKGFALIAVLCALNALRRKIQPQDDDTVIGWLADFGVMFGLGLIVALPVALAVVATCNHDFSRPWRRYAALACAVVAASLAGTILMATLEWAILHPLNLGDGGTLAMATAFLRWFWLRYLAMSALFTAVYVYARTAEESAMRARDAELDHQRFEQQMEEARLQVLQAQIEPHFLFNTLATVRSLYRESHEAARGMLDNLMRYLGVALPQMRSGGTTLGREAALAEAYLGIQKLRMGRRLAYAIDIPPALHDVPMPPMMLLTLVENAIKHGLAPLPEGGFIRVGATVEHDELRLQVSDSGRGFAQTSGAGTGIANIRARLDALHGRAARLDLGLNQPRGVTATLTLPLSTRGAAP
jgi:signal transduction histidine kinase